MSLNVNPESLIRKNASWYGVRIIITGMAAFTGIILTKRQLAAQEFIEFNILVNGVTLLNSFLVAWFGQSIVRFYHSYHYFFRMRRTVQVVAVNFFLVGLPAFFIWRFFIGIRDQAGFPLLYMFVNAMFTALLSLFQAAHGAKVVTLADSLRSIILITFLLIPALFGIHIDSSFFWISWIASCAVPCIFLLAKRHTLRASGLFNSQGDANEDSREDNQLIIKRLIKFGFPLSAWVFVSFLMLNADKWYIYKVGISEETAANYVALSDLMSRGMGFVFSPIVSSAYPILSNMFDKNLLEEVKKLISKVVKWQFLLAVVASIGFVVTSKLVFSLMQIIEHNYQFLIIGLCLIFVNTIWNVSAMYHKVAELGLKTPQMLGALIFVTIVVYSCYYYLLKPVSIYWILGVSGLGYMIYFAFTFQLFIRYKWKKGHDEV